MRRLLTIFSLFLLLSVSPCAAFELGVAVHQSNDKNLQIIRDLGLNSVRSDFLWQMVEPQKGQYKVPEVLPAYFEKASRANIAPLLVLAYGNSFYDGGKKPHNPGAIEAFADYARFAARALSGQARQFEVWNEWEDSPEAYFKVLKPAALAIKSANKDALVLTSAPTTAGMASGWAEKLVGMGAMRYVDGISLHPYLHCEADATPEAWIGMVGRHSRNLKAANGGKEVPIYITEMGWPTHVGSCQTSQEKQAQYLPRALFLARTLPEVKGFWWYDLKDDGIRVDEPEDNFGFLRNDYRPKPAFAALRDIAPIILAGRSFTRIPTPADVVMVAVSDVNGKRSFAVWATAATTGRVVLSTVPAYGASPSLFKVGAGKGSRLPLAKRAEVAVDGTPRLIEGVNEVRVERVLW